MKQNCDTSNARQSLMKTLKKIKNLLDISPNCHMKPYYPCKQCICPSPCMFRWSCRNHCCCSDSCQSCKPCCSDSNNCSCRSCKPCCSCCCRRNRFCCKPLICYKPFCKCCYPCCQSNCCCGNCSECLNGTICGNTLCLPRCSNKPLNVKHSPCFNKLTCSKSVELRGGILYRGCDCDKKNGLQDQCLRFCCIDNPRCNTTPASCTCSKYSCGKHLIKRYSKKGKCYICRYPILPCVRFFPCCRMCPTCCCCNNNCCSNKCEAECQCIPSTCEVDCCCSFNEEPC